MAYRRRFSSPSHFFVYYFCICWSGPYFPYLRNNLYIVHLNTSNLIRLSALRTILVKKTRLRIILIDIRSKVHQQKLAASISCNNTNSDDETLAECRVTLHGHDVERSQLQRYYYYYTKAVSTQQYPTTKV